MRSHQRIVLRLVLFVCLILITVPVAMAQDDTAPLTEATEEADVTGTQETPSEAESTETATPKPVPTEEPDGIVYYVVSGDTLFRIAMRYGVRYMDIAALNGITNPALIYTGQRLIIPTTTPTVTPQPTSEPTAEPTSTPTTPPTPEPTSTPDVSGTREYTVQYGDTLFRIASRNGTTANEIIRLNPQITNPNVIYLGMRLRLPSTTPTDSGTPSLDVTPVDGAPELQADFAQGVEIFPFGQDINVIINQLAQLNIQWVKVTVDWRDIEPLEGDINFDNLDPVIQAIDSAGFNILLNVTGAPDWARPDADPAVNAIQTGPPTDLNTFGRFVTAMVSRYGGVVDAYEIWKQPNIRTWWRAQDSPARMSDTKYTDLLTVAYNAIKSADPQAFVVTAALAPTQFNDRVNAIDDRVFVQGLYDNNVERISDAIGVAPDGFANPPDNRAPTRANGVESHYERGVFFFLDTISDYRQIMIKNDDGDRPLWVTQFGWGTADGNMLTAPDETTIYFTYTSPEEQAEYTLRAFEIGQESGYIGPMVLYNLNACQVGDATGCFYSLVDGNNAARPLFSALTSPAVIPDAESTDEPLPETTPEVNTEETDS